MDPGKQLKTTSWIQLQNIEDGSTMDWYNTDLGESPWFETLVASQEWVGRQEEARTIQHESPQHQMVIQFYQGSLCQGNLGPAPSFPRSWTSP